jgi:hypothetical protein
MGASYIPYQSKGVELSLGLLCRLKFEGTPAAALAAMYLSATECGSTELTPRSDIYMAGSRRAEQVMRRLTAILAIWLSLLGVAVPVLACSMGVAGDGCCPLGTESPCGGGESQLNSTTVSLCCSAGPASASGPSVESRRTIQSPVHPGTPEQFVVSGWRTTHPDSATPQFIVQSSIRPHRADAALTYLRTGRLRL